MGHLQDHGGPDREDQLSGDHRAEHAFPPGAFLRGDSNRDGEINIGDPIATLTFLFIGGEALPCEDGADANDDGQLELTDAIVTLHFLFLGTAVLKAPGTRYPWFDPTPDPLGCGGL